MSRIDDIVANAYKALDAPYNRRELRERRARRMAAKRRAEARAASAKLLRREVTGDANKPDMRGRWSRDGWGRTGNTVGRQGRGSAEDG